MDVGSLIPALVSKKIDVAVSGISPTKARAKKVAFTKPYYSEQNCVLFNRNKDILRSVNDLEGKMVAATLGVVQQNLVEKYFKRYKFYNNNFQMVEDLKIGRIDAVIIGKDQCIKFKEKHLQLDYFRLSKGYNEESRFAIAVRKDLKGLLNDLDKVMVSVVR